MNNATRIIAALVATFGLTILAPATAHAEPTCHDRAGRVSPEEYAQLELGMTFAEVRALVGSKGAPMDPYWMSKAVRHMERTWRVTCSRTGGAHLSFERVGGQWSLEWAQVRWS